MNLNQLNAYAFSISEFLKQLELQIIAAHRVVVENCTLFVF
jgi:hypothetical protein